jgi:hypothetical protein
MAVAVDFPTFKPANQVIRRIAAAPQEHFPAVLLRDLRSSREPEPRLNQKGSAARA